MSPPTQTVMVTSGAGEVNTGGVVSFTVTSCTEVAVLPDTSVAVQVTRVDPGPKLAGALFVIVTGVPQSSTAVGGVNTSGPQADTVRGGGTDVNRGAVRS